MRRTLSLVAAVAALGILAAAPANAGVTGPAPRYLAFEAVYEIPANGAILVTETIDVEFIGQRHGIFRDLDVKVRIKDDPDHLRVYVVAFESVTRNGEPEPVELIRSGSQEERLQAKIGSADTLLDGRHRYELKYQLHFALDTYPDHEEFFWDVTGHGWEAPFEQVRAVVRSPEAEITRVVCFAEAEGSSEPHRNCLKSDHDFSEAVFEDDFLGDFEEMTIAVAFPPREHRCRRAHPR